MKSKNKPSQARAPPRDLAVLDVLRRRASPKEPLSPAEVTRALDGPDHHTVKDALEKLEGAGLAVRTVGGSGGRARWHALPTLPEKERRLLEDAILGLNELDENGRRELIEGLCVAGVLASADTHARPAPSASEVSAASITEGLLNNLSAIHEAIENGWQLKLTLNEPMAGDLGGPASDGSRSLMRLAPNPKSKLVVPRSCPVVDGRHYLVYELAVTGATLGGKAFPLHHIALDLIGEATTVETNNVRLSAVDERVRLYPYEHPFMAEGEPIEVEFVVKDEGINCYLVQEQFGEAFWGWSGVVCGWAKGTVTCCEEGAILWALAHAGEVKIVGPEAVRKKVAARARRLASDYDLDVPPTFRAVTSRGDPVIEEFLSDLAAQTSSGGQPFENPYADKDGVCYANLRRYLETLRRSKPRVMLLGRSLGRRGGAKTGVPFTDEKHLYDEPKTRFARLMGAGQPYIDLHGGKRPGNDAEPSATLVWEGLADWGELPLIWNVFPYHSHMQGQPNTNRKPNASEMEMGMAFVRRLKDMFGIDRDHVYCLGGDAWKEMFPGVPRRSEARDRHYIRMPTDGGEKDCVRRLRELGRQL
ncbi:MAG: hypothetical protein MR415_00945 [Coriobacteriaceae bacterium]|nr:hypothetical protein [Coriobacteriaceae bacterium]